MVLFLYLTKDWQLIKMHLLICSRYEVLLLKIVEGYVTEMGPGLSRSEMYVHLTRSFGISVA